MNGGALSALPIAHHGKMLTVAMPACAGVAICEADGGVAWTDSRLTVERLVEATRLLAATPDVNDGMAREFADGWLLVWPVSAAGDRLGAVIVALDHGEAADPGGWRRARTLVAEAAGCLADLHAREDELDAMARELGERYEELNLLYTMDEKVGRYEPSCGRDVLAQMVADCAGHLGVDAVYIYAPGESLDLCHLRPDVSALLSAAWPAVRVGLLRALRERSRPLVSNTADNAARAGLGGKVAAKVLAVPLRDVHGAVCGTLATLNGVDARDYTTSDRKLMEVLAEQASRVIVAGYDQVTGLLGREALLHRAAEALQVAPSDAVRGCMLYIDLDQFRLINDNAGRAAGDALLSQVAGRLRKATRHSDLLGRLEADAFAVVLVGCTLTAAMRAAKKLESRLAGWRFGWGERQFDVSACLGVAAIGDGQDGLVRALGAAEAACMVARQGGRGQVRVYDAGDPDYADLGRQVEWAPRIERALHEDGFVLFAQTIAPVAGGAHGVAHHEVLLRFVGDDGALVAPGVFIPAAERYRLMPRLDRWVLRTLLAALASEPPGTETVFSVNLSGQSLADPSFEEHVVQAVQASGVPFRRLCFEITETAAIANLDAAVRFIERLRGHGSRFSLDDFGSGLSSFGYLKRLPVDYLKIDGCIVRDMVEDRVSAAMVQAINQLGHVMGLATVAEFVENDAILASLRALGVDHAQGYGIGRPGPLALVLARTGAPEVIGALTPARQAAG